MQNNIFITIIYLTHTPPPTAPGDYSPLSVMLLMFNAGTTRACANLITETDQVVEGLETLELRLTTDDSAVILNPDTSNVKIVDTDSESLDVNFLY